MLGVLGATYCVCVTGCKVWLMHLTYNLIAATKMHHGLASLKEGVNILLVTI